MEPQLCLLLLLASLSGATAGYRTYSVEGECGSGNLSVPLNATGPASASLVRATDRTSYSLAMDCRILLSSPQGCRIVVSVRQIGFRTRWDGSCRDYLQIVDRPMCAHLFRVDEERHFESADNAMEMLYHVSQAGVNNSTLTGHPGFEVVVTAFMEGQDECPSTGDDDRRFRCNNDRCIWSGLRCDSHNNCGDLSDELECDTATRGNSSVLIILGGLIVLLLLIMCIATLLCSKNERVRRFSNRIRTRTLSYIRRFSR